MDLIDYTKCTITNIRRGTGKRAIFIYAELRNEKGEIVTNATLDYIVKVLNERLPVELQAADSFPGDG